MFNSKQKNFGILKVEGRIVKVYETQSVYSNLNIGHNVADARWAGDAIIVELMDGKMRRYTTLSQYVTV
jgi:hypothetical protein